jgi:hypothetical protein
VKLLLKDKRVDPASLDNYAVRHAAENGFCEVVELLLDESSVDPGARDNRAVFRA